MKPNQKSAWITYAADIQEVMNLNENYIFEYLLLEIVNMIRKVY